MSERRTLTKGLSETPPATSTSAEKQFVFGQAAAEPSRSTPTRSPSTPLNTRLRADFVAALKRASLERQLAGTEPNTLRAILEEAIEPWLADRGYLP